MFHALKNLWEKNKKIKLNLAQFKTQFFADESHQWINGDIYLKRAFQQLLDNFPSILLSHSHHHEKIVFVKASGRLACTVYSTDNLHAIIIFPDLEKLLKSGSPNHGLAILAHELGHIVLKHSQQKITTLRAQFEADDFAYQMGFGEELLDVMMDHPDNLEVQFRIVHLQKLIEQEAK
ncbi:MAG: M48 family metalloprotease [Pseudomonadota bacterium]